MPDSETPLIYRYCQKLLHSMAATRTVGCECAVRGPPCGLEAQLAQCSYGVRNLRFTIFPVTSVGPWLELLASENRFLVRETCQRLTVCFCGSFGRVLTQYARLGLSRSQAINVFSTVT